MPQTARPSGNAQIVGSSPKRERQFQDLRFLETLEGILAGCRDVQAVYGSVVHRVASAFEVDAVCLAAYEPIGRTLEIVHKAGKRTEWDVELLQRAIDEERTIGADDLVVVAIISPPMAHAERHVWGALAIRRIPSPNTRSSADLASERQTLRAAADRIGAELERRRVYLMDDVLDDLLRKAKPIDVYTHALRELRRFVRYDHSASVMTMQRGMPQLTVRVEKLVRARGRTDTLADSSRQGRVIRVTDAQMRYLSSLEEPIELNSDGSGWRITGKQDPEAAGLWGVLGMGEGAGEGSVLCYPLIFGGQMLGILRLAALRSGAFDPIALHARTLDRFARLLSVTLYRSELYHQSDRQLQAIKQIGRAITEPISVEEVCQQVLQLALRVLHVQVGVVGLLTPEGKLELIAHQGSTLRDVPTIEIGQGISGAVVQSGRSWVVSDVSAEPSYVVFNSRVRSELVAPIVYNREVIGFLDVESFEMGRFREEDEEVITFLEALANQAAIAIKTAQLHAEAVRRLGTSVAIDPSLSMAGLQDLLMQELRDKIEQLGAANDRLATANRAKSEFLAHMSHDLRGPLNVIVGLAGLLTDSSVAETMTPEKRQESLEVIRSSGEVLGSLIGNILDLSALEAGKVELSISTFDAAAAFGYLRAMARSLAEESMNDLDIVITVDPAITTIQADEDKFLRIMINLVSNAVKFTPSGGRVEVHALAEPGEEYSEDTECVLHVIVQDTGVGIPAEYHESIFDPFHQVEGEAQRHGSGLGLAVVRQLAELHSGRVWVESVPGQGSTFHVILPHALPVSPIDPEPVCAVSDGQPEDESERIEPEVELDPHSRGLVLVVEDTEAHMSVMRLAVTSRGYTMHGVSSGEEALAWLDEHLSDTGAPGPDVILLDMQLPGMDGFELAAHIKNRLETHTIPIIAVTADALKVNEQRAIASGCDAYLTKPIDIGNLLTTIDAVSK